MKFKKSLAVILALLMLACTFVACAQPQDNGDQTTTTASAQGTPDGGETTPAGGEQTEETTAPKATLTVPEDLTYNDKTFTIFTWSNQSQWEWDSEEITGELIDDAIYDRRMKTEIARGIKLEIIKEPGEWENRNAFISKLAANVQAGSHAFDLVGQYTPAAAIGAMQGLYLPFGDIEHLDTAQAWWPGDIRESSAINGNLYFITGDITPTLVRNMGCILANTDLTESFGIPDLYEIVDKGEWTLDKLLELSLGQVSSLNDGQQYYGFTITNNVSYDNLFYGAGFKFVTANADGTISMSDDLYGEKLVKWFEKCQAMLRDNADVDLVATNSAFTAERSIFHLGSVADVQNYLKDVTFDFAILPAPKYDTAQEEYATIVGYWVSFYSIPLDAQDPSMSGAVLETLGYYGAECITPAFYEEAFQYRYLGTENNARMFDLLHDTLVYDTGRFFADQLSCFSAFRKAAVATENWTSYVKGMKRVWDKNIATIYDKLG